MKLALRLLLLMAITLNFSYAQRAKLKVEGVSAYEMTKLGLSAATNTISTGLNVVGNQTNVYLSPMNIGNTDAITNAVYTITAKPGGSTAALTSFNTDWAYFKADVKGQYDVKLVITTATGSDDTTISIFSADYVGVGNFEGVAGTFPKCMTCHGNTPKFSAIFDRWKVSGHANIFNTQITTAASYGTNCMTCHTTGYNSTASNGGFDDVASQLGWVWSSPTNPGKWDSLKTNYPGLVNMAAITCENCHGAGSEHAATTDKRKIAISVEEATCASCHDAPTHHTKVAEFDNSLHSEALWSSSFAQGSSSQNNSLGNCIRCHDANGFINFTKGQTTNTTGMVEADHKVIACATCHDPHGNTNTASLRFTPAGSDTLANGFHYTTIGGAGQTCMNCHKSRGDVTVNLTAAVTQRWGPHHSTQTDVLMGKNAADFGTAFTSGSHSLAIADACVTCHMTATTSDSLNNGKVGGHTFRLKNPDTGYEYTAACTGCHGAKADFDAFIAASDYDNNGTIEGIQTEIEGMLKNLSIALPPAGVDSISYALIASMNDLNIKKAYWNYQLIANDGSRGMHNAKFAVDVLSKSITAIGGITPVELVSFDAEVEKGSVTLKWETATETNNKGFSIEQKSGNNWKSIKFVDGKGTTTISNSYSYSFKLEGTASLRLKQVDFDGSFKYSKVIEVIGSITPKEYTLMQNYPNPFNPSTTIKFSLPFDSNVKVVIYGVTGQVVKVLVNGAQTAGSHDVQFNTNETGTGVSSGIYFYSIEANSLDGSANFKQTKKMVLIK